jgi:autotransporter-associated beta strand protein
VVDAGGVADPLGSANPVGLLPAQVRHAYGIDQISFGNGSVAGDGSGQTIAIIDAFDDPNIANDLHQFDLRFSLPDPAFTKVAQDGSTNYPPPNSGWITEIALDVEWSHAVAPGANLLLVEAQDASFNNLNAAVDYARNQPGVVAVSMSYGAGEFSGETAYDSFFNTPLGHGGVTFFSATGDAGKPGLYQAYSPNVVAVGGTTLSVDASGNYLSESGWSGSGGGLSLLEAQPPYQNGVVTQSSTQRTIPDVAFVGGTGVAVYDSYNNGPVTPWYAVAGTSLSTPCWAGLIAIADQGRALNVLGSLDGPTQTLPALYQLPASDFHDITTGNNGFPAGAGYDLVTGRGSPVANLLVDDLAQPQVPVARTWTGAGPDGNWSDALNWTGGVAPNPGDVLVFGPGAAQFTSTNDFAAGTAFRSIRFTGSGYTVSGNDVTLTSSLDASSATGSNTCNLNVTLGGLTAFNGGGTSTSLTLGGNLNDAGYTVQVGGGKGSITFGGVISGGGGLNDLSAGTLVLSGANSYSGGTTLNSTGSLALANASALGTGTLTLNGGTVQASAGPVSVANAVTVAGNVTFGGTFSLTFAGPATLTLSPTLTVTNTGTTTFAGGVGQAGGTWGLTKAGTGLLVLSGSGSYGGTTTLSAGTLAVGNGAALGTNTLILTAGTIQASGGPVSLANAVTLAGNVTFGGSTALTFNGLATLTASRTLTVTNTAGTAFAGGIGQAGGVWGLTKAGAGLLVLPVADTYTGTTTLTSGALQVGDPCALGAGTLLVTGGTLQGSGTALTLNNPVTLGGNLTVGGSSALTFAGAATLTGNRTLTTNNTGGTTFTGGIAQAGGTWGLTKAGTGLLVLSGGGSYGGTTTLSAGTLAVANAAALGSGALALSGGTLQASGGPLSLANAVTLSGNATVGGIFDLTFTGLATLTGTRTLTVSNTGTTTLAGGVGQSGGTWGLTKSGTGLLVLAGAGGYGGTTTLSAGTLAVGNAAALGTGTLALNGGRLQASAGPLFLANALTLSGNVTFGGTFDLTFAGPVTLTGNRTLTVTNTGTTTFAGTIGQSGGTWGLTKAGVGLLVLSGTDSYGGTTTLSAGTLGLGNAAALGSGTLALSGGTLEAVGGPLSLANAVTLGGNVTLGGACDLTFTGPATLTYSRTLTVTNTGTTAFAGNIGATAAYALTKAGPGVLVLSGTNTYTGGTTINAGALLVNGSQASGVTVNSGGTLGGTGTMGAVTVNAGGAVYPGNGSSTTGILNSGNLALKSGSSFTVALNDVTPGTGYDQLNVTGTVNLTGSTLNLSLGFTPDVGTVFTLVNNDGVDAVVGTFQGLAEGATVLVNGMTFQISYVGGTGNDVTLTRIA